jgi:hypothetical protein
LLTITDAGAATSYKINSPAGEYGILSCSAGGGFVSGQGDGGNVGLLFYQAGVAVLSSSVFLGPQGGGVISDENALMFGADSAEPNSSFSGSLTGSTIQASCDAIRHRLYDLSYNNTTELNSTIHFCRVNNNDYNYSANPTYLSASKIVVKNNTLDAPVSYITAVGLYSADNELLATAKLSEPLKKDPTNEMTIRVRLDY